MNDFKCLFLKICDIKKNVLKLKSEDLKKYKSSFYSQNFPKWRLDLMWEFIWDDVDFETIKYIFENNRII